MIPEEAIEAAAGVIALGEMENAHYLKVARIALEAAAPYIAGQAWDAAVDAMVYEDGSKVELAHNRNPYRSQA